MSRQEITLWIVSIAAAFNAVAVFTMAYTMWKHADRLASIAHDLRRLFDYYVWICSDYPTKDGEQK